MLKGIRKGMKKLLYYSDVHYTDKKPSSRKDDYRQSIMNKLIHIDELSREHKVDMVVCGGDVSHKFNENFRIFVDLYNYFSNTFVKHHVVAGFNHDFAGGNYETGLPNSILGALKKTGCLIEVGQTFEFELDRVKFYTSHRSICPTPFFGSYELYSDLKCDASVILLSHLHMPFGVDFVNNKHFVSPGSVGRNAADTFNLSRNPQCALIIVDNGNVISIELLNLKCELDVFDQQYLINRDKDNALGHVSSLDSLETFMEQEEGILDASSIIHRLGERYDKEAVEMALEFKGRVDNE